LKSNTVGTYNTCVGYNANVTSNNLSFSTAIGVSAQITTSHQIVLGTADEYVFIPGSLRMNISPIHLYGDTYHYLKYGAGEDGPVLRGFAGGALGTTYPAVKNVMTWNNTCVSTNQLPLRLYSATNNDYRIQYRSDSKTEITGWIGGVLGTTSGTAKDILAWNTDSVIVYTSLSLSGGNSYLSAVGVNVGASKIRYNNNNFVFTGTGETPNYNEAVGSNNICLGKQPMGNASGTVSFNIAMGFGALFLAINTYGTIALGSSAARNMIGNYNVAIGHDALNGIQSGTLYDATTYGSGDTSGTNNVAVGHSAGTVCRSGNNNTFLGAGTDFTGGPFNNSTALGYNAKITASNQIMLGTASETVVIPSGLANVNGFFLRAANFSVSFSNQQPPGGTNVSIGFETMGASTIDAASNVAIGHAALFIARGTHNVGLGYCTARNMTGSHNIAIGYQALWGIYNGDWGILYTGAHNVSIGVNSGQLCRNGNNNTFLGSNADIDAVGHTFDGSTALGYAAKITASNQIVLGTSDNVCIIAKKLTIGTGGVGTITSTSTDTGGNGCLQITCQASIGMFSEGISIAVSNNSAAFIGFHNNGGTRVGNIICVGGTGTSYTTTSDARKKTNIVNLPSVLDKIKRIHPRSFTWIDTNREDDGFIAQEIFEVFPALNPMSHDDRFTDKLNPVDESGNIVVLGVDYGKLTPYLWGGLKETLQLVETQQSQIDAQQSQITSLQSQIDELRQMVLAMSNK
jgi:hypothetical protein